MAGYNQNPFFETLVGAVNWAFCGRFICQRQGPHYADIITVKSSSESAYWKPFLNKLQLSVVLFALHEFYNNLKEVIHTLLTN